MASAGIKLNVSKCKTGQKEVNFLGHVLSKGRYKPDTANMEAAVRMKPPTNVQEARRFLGVLKVYREICQDSSANNQFNKEKQPLCMV